MKTGIFYGSTTGNTADIAIKIHKQLGEGDIINVNSSSLSLMNNYDNIIIGASTWGDGELQGDWEDHLSDLKSVDFSGKKVAFFGLGDQISYPDTFIDAIGIIYDEIKDSGAQFIGNFPVDGFDYNYSKAEQNGDFIGLAIDENNQSELTHKRIEEWVKKIKPELSL